MICGILDHRNARDMIRKISKNKRVLNLFAYTGAFTCYAIEGFAKKTTTVDLNPNYCKWAERNIYLNGGATSDDHAVLASDCIRYLNHSRDTFDIIICDPPTFSNSKRGSTEPFSINEDHVDLIRLCEKRLSDSGLLFFSSNSKSFRLNEDLLPSSLSVQETSSTTIPEDFKGSKIHKSWILKKSIL